MAKWRYDFNTDWVVEGNDGVEYELVILVFGDDVGDGVSSLSLLVEVYSTHQLQEVFGDEQYSIGQESILEIMEAAADLPEENLACKMRTIDGLAARIYADGLEALYNEGVREANKGKEGGNVLLTTKQRASS